jgi:hypothetical protein
MKRFILWDYPRASWQYDLMVGLILAFIFLTPKALFRDQPRPSHVVQIEADTAAPAFWMDPEMLSETPESARLAEASKILNSRTGKKHTLVRVEPVYDPEKELRGYIAYTRP